MPRHTIVKSHINSLFDDWSASAVQSIDISDLESSPITIATVDSRIGTICIASAFIFAGLSLLKWWCDSHWMRRDKCNKKLTDNIIGDVIAISCIGIIANADVEIVPIVAGLYLSYKLVDVSELLDS